MTHINDELKKENSVTSYRTVNVLEMVRVAVAEIGDNREIIVEDIDGNSKISVKVRAY